MRYLSQLIWLLLLPVQLWAQSPHGDNFNMKCEVCHSPEGWNLIEHPKFDHDTTGFALKGTHQSVACRQCHVSLVFSQAPANCNACHNDIHENTVGPDCDQCHNTTTWAVTDIMEIHLRSRFPLTGAHTMADCYDCHKSISLMRFDPIGVECYDCHKDDFLATTNPNHVASGFSTECTDCHFINAVNWASEGFNHDFFPLTEGHAISDCAACHQNGVFTGLSPECYSCHSQDYNNATDPNHVSAGFSQQCQDCHTTHPGWSPATFNHDDFYPLTGAHADIANDCLKCHANGYSNTPTDCYGCHKTDYDNTTDPNHLAANFPTTCDDCHTDVAWKPATFDHDGQYFPIYSGTHSQAWTSCSDCHTNASNYADFSCIDCHEHEKTTTDEHHREVRNYVYNSVNCYECHPNGRAED